MRPSTLGIAIAALVASFASASAQTPVPAGILECQGGQNVGFVVGSVTQLECVFRSEGRPPEGYTATVRRIGVDLGFTEQTQFSWAVSAPSMRLGRGALAGNLRRRRRQCVGGHRFRRQLSGWRSGQCLWSAADQRARPDRSERRRRCRRHRAAAGRVCRSRCLPVPSPPSLPSASPLSASPSPLSQPKSPSETGLRKRAFFVGRMSGHRQGLIMSGSAPARAPSARGKSGATANVMA